MSDLVGNPEDRIFSRRGSYSWFKFILKSPPLTFSCSHVQLNIFNDPLLSLVPLVHVFRTFLTSDCLLGHIFFDKKMVYRIRM